MTHDTLMRLIAEFPGSDVFWGVARVGETDVLHPEEVGSVARAIPARRAEFCAGRLAARRALAVLGLGDAGVPAGSDRAPNWPKGVTGSITHSAGWAIAAVARSEVCYALGIDLEQTTALMPDLVPVILRPEEIAACQDPNTEGKRIFSVKEAVYKAMYPKTKIIFGFQGMHVSLARGEAQITDHPETRTLPSEWRTTVMPFHQALGGGLMVSLCRIDHAPHNALSS